MVVTRSVSSTQCVVKAWLFYLAAVLPFHGLGSHRVTEKNGELGRENVVGAYWNKMNRGIPFKSRIDWALMKIACISWLVMFFRIK